MDLFSTQKITLDMEEFISGYEIWKGIYVLLTHQRWWFVSSENFVARWGKPNTLRWLSAKTSNRLFWKIGTWTNHNLKLSKQYLAFLLPPTCCTEEGNQYPLHKCFWVNTSFFSSKEDWKLTLNQFSFNSPCQHNRKSYLFLSTVA